MYLYFLDLQNNKQDNVKFHRNCLNYTTYIDFKNIEKKAKETTNKSRPILPVNSEFKSKPPVNIEYNTHLKLCSLLSTAVEINRLS